MCAKSLKILTVFLNAGMPQLLSAVVTERFFQLLGTQNYVTADCENRPEVYNSRKFRIMRHSYYYVIDRCV